VPLVGVAALGLGCDGEAVAAGASLVRVSAAGVAAAPRALLSPGASSVAVAPSGTIAAAGTAGEAAFVQRADGVLCAPVATLAGPAPAPPSRVVSAPAGPSGGPVPTTAASGVAKGVLKAREATRIRRAADVVALPRAGRCVAGRRLSVRIDVPDGAAVVDVTLRVDGRRRAVRRGAGRWSTVRLAALPRGRFRLEAAVRLADESVLRAARRYRSCR
jgi:hypothetical protein